MENGLTETLIANMLSWIVSKTLRLKIMMIKAIILEPVSVRFFAIMMEILLLLFVLELLVIKEFTSLLSTEVLLKKIRQSLIMAKHIMFHEMNIMQMKTHELMQGLVERI